MAQRQCATCHETKPINEFPEATPGNYRSACRPCWNALRRERESTRPALSDTLVTGSTAIPEGYSVRGVSTLYGGDGSVKGQWVKTDRDQQGLTWILDAMATIADKWTGLADPVESPTVSDDDLLVAYVIGDAHVGLYSWAPESGTNHDLATAEHDLYAAVDHLVSVAPPAKRALLVNVGDFYHSDGKGNMTTGGTPVDVDGRWPKVLSVGVRIMRRAIDRALEKHEHVTVVNEIGNHDQSVSVMLAVCLAQFYEREPRVTIDTSPMNVHWYRFGNVMIGTTHGDRLKIEGLGEIMACDRKHDWAETEHRYWILGHVHHRSVKELKGCTVETFPTLAPGDAWHRNQGYRASRSMTALVFHRKWGQVNRHTVGINQLLDRSA